MNESLMGQPFVKCRIIWPRNGPAVLLAKREAGKTNSATKRQLVNLLLMGIHIRLGTFCKGYLLGHE